MDLIIRQSHWALEKKRVQSRASNPGFTLSSFILFDDEIVLFDNRLILLDNLFFSPNFD